MINQELTREKSEKKKMIVVILTILLLLISGIAIYLTINSNSLDKENSALKEQNCILVNFINKENTLLEQTMNLPEGTFVRVNYPEDCVVIP